MVGIRRLILSLVITAVLAVMVRLVATRTTVVNRGVLPVSPSSNEPAVRNFPLQIEPVLVGVNRIDESRVVGILAIAVPRWDPPTVPIMLHALRLWGADAKFVNAEPNDSSERFIETLLNSKKCDNLIGQFNGFLTATDRGVRVLTSGDMLKTSINAEPHVDKLLQVLGECQIPLNKLVIDSDLGRHTVEDILRESFWRFSLTQELEFTTNAYVLWLPPTKHWTNRFGQQFSFDDLAEALISRPIGEGVCQGTHVPYALTMMIRANMLYPGTLSPSQVKAAETRLMEISVALEFNESPNGGWDKYWSGGYIERPENMFFEFKPHFDRIAVTGHHLEWIAMAPENLRPSATVIQRSEEALARQIEGLSDEDLDKPKGYLPITHAARAFMFLRGTRFASLFRPSAVDLGIGSDTEPFSETH